MWPQSLLCTSTTILNVAYNPTIITFFTHVPRSLLLPFASSPILNSRLIASFCSSLSLPESTPSSITNRSLLPSQSHAIVPRKPAPFTLFELVPDALEIPFYSRTTCTYAGVNGVNISFPCLLRQLLLPFACLPIHILFCHIVCRSTLLNPHRLPWQITPCCPLETS
jgi:hypothetical protein